MCQYPYSMEHMCRSEDNLEESLLAFHHVGPGLNSVIRIGTKHLYLLNHLELKNIQFSLKHFDNNHSYFQDSISLCSTDCWGTSQRTTKKLLFPSLSLSCMCYVCIGVHVCRHTCQQVRITLVSSLIFPQLLFGIRVSLEQRFLWLSSLTSYVVPWAPCHYLPGIGVSLSSPPSISMGSGNLDFMVI